MNKKINLKKGYKGTIIKVLHVTGLLLYDDLQLLAEKQGHLYLWRRFAHELERDGYIRIEKSNNKKYMRFSMYNSHIEEYIDNIGQEYVSYYLTHYEDIFMYQESANLKTKSINERNAEYSKRSDNLRKLAEANTRLIMLMCGYIDISQEPAWKRNQEKESNQIMTGTNQYFNNRESKYLESGQINLRASRSNGLLMSDGGDYVIYNTGNRLIQWHASAEGVYNHYIKTLVSRYSSDDRKRTLWSFEEKKCPLIIIGSRASLVRLCTEKVHNVQRVTGKTLLCVENKEVSTNEAICPVSNDTDAFKMLALITDAALRDNSIRLIQELNMDFFEDKYKKQFRDGYIMIDGEQISVLNFIYPDTVKLSNFVRHELTALPENTAYRARLYCTQEYEWYVRAVIEKFIEELGIAQSVDECIWIFVVTRKMLGLAET